MAEKVECSRHGEEPAMTMEIGNHYKKIVCVHCYFDFIADAMHNFTEDDLIIEE